MSPIETCPTCGSDKHDKLHTLELANEYSDSEAALQRTNNYQRNHILFTKILKDGEQTLLVDFLICKQCGLEFFTPRPDDDDLAVKYQHVIASKVTEKREKKFELVDLRQRRAKEIAARINPFVKNKMAAALDIGGADGHCLTAIDSQKKSVLDFEKRDMYDGVERVGNTLADLSETDKFDLVICCHTLEHIADLNEFLSNIRDHTTDEGLLYIEVPNGCNGEIYTTKNIITHLNFFSTESLSYLLEKNGFEVEKCVAGPVLSKKRYLDVVTAVARKGKSSVKDSNDAYLGTIKETEKNNATAVTAKNIALVLSNPIAYSRAVLARFS